jgi:hypothetical protein
MVFRASRAGEMVFVDRVPVPRERGIASLDDELPQRAGEMVRTEQPDLASQCTANQRRSDDK